MTRYVLILTLLLCCFITGCKSIPADVDQELVAQQNQMWEASRSVEFNENEQAWAITLYDAIWQLRFRCGAVDDVPADVRARREARASTAPVKSGQ